jgi:hypothetical protein
MLHYNLRHVSNINMTIFRKTNCIIRASGIVTLCKRLYSMPDALIRHTVQNRIKWRSDWNSRNTEFIMWSVLLWVSKRKSFRLHKLIKHNSQHVCSINSRFKQLLIGAFAKFGKTTINFVTCVSPPVSPSVYVNQLVSYQKNFHDV